MTDHSLELGGGSRLKGTRGLGLISALVAVLLLIVGCSADQKSSQPGSSTTLNIGFILAPAGLDPGSAPTTGNGHWYYMLAYDSLIKMSADNKPEPALAKSWQYIGAGNMVFQMQLRPGVKFSDGTPLTADAVKKYIEYYRAHAPGAIYLTDIKSVDVVDNLTLRINLSQPNPELPYIFSQYGSGAGWVTSSAALSDPAQLATKTFGAGPYMLDAANTVANDHYTYVPNPQYWNKAAVHYKKVVIKVLTNANTALAAIKTGQVDVIRGDYTTASGAKAAGLKVLSTPLNSIGLGLADQDGKLVKALSDVRVRQALNYAVNRKAINSGLFGTLGATTEEVGSNVKIGTVYSYNPTKAKQLLAEAGYANGFDLPVVTGTEQGQALVQQAIASDLAKVGVRVKLTTDDASKFFPDMTSQKWPAYGLLFGDLPIHMGTALLELPDAPFNPFHISDPKLIQLREAAAAASPSTKDQADAELMRYVVEQAWFVPVVKAPAVFYVSSRVTGVSSSGAAWLPDPTAFRPAS